MSSVIYGQLGIDAPGGESDGYPVLSINGNFPLGATPGTFTVEVAGPFVLDERTGTPIPTGGGGAPGTGGYPDGNPLLHTLFTPETPKKITVGDEKTGTITFKSLWVDTVDGNSLNDDNCTHTVTLQDRRVWWGRRGVMGVRSWNGEQFGELPGIIGGNLRYPAYRLRTVMQMFGDIFAHLGEGAVQLTGANGFADLNSIKVAGHPIAEHTPAFTISAGETAVSALMRLCALYDLIPAISPDSPTSGLIARSTLTKKLDGTYDKVVALGGTSGKWNPVANSSTAFDRESLPDTIMLKGSPILIGDFLTLEPVTEDPDRPGVYIPLFLRSTLQAFGVDFFQAGRGSFQNGRGIARLAIMLASRPDLAPEIPPRFKDTVKKWFQIWRVAQPMEEVQTSESGEQLSAVSGGSPAIQSRVRNEVDDTTGKTKYTRVVSPQFRLLRTKSAPDTGGLMSTTAGKSLWQPDGSTSDYAEPHRWFPLLPHTEKVGFDGQLEPMSVRGANVLMAVQVKGQQGNEGQDWVSVGPINLDPESLRHNELADLGLTPTIIDAASGVVDLGQPVYGHDGLKDGETSIASARTSGAANKGATLASLVLREEFCNRGNADDSGQPEEAVATGGGEGEGEEEETEEKEESEPCLIAPLSMPYLQLRCSYFKNSHGDERDYTSTYSGAPRSGGGFVRGPDPQLADLILPNLDINLYGGAQPPALPAEPSGDRSNPSEIWVKPTGFIQLRGKTSRAALPPGGNAAASSFERDGGWDSGEITGYCTHFDVDLTTFDDLEEGGFTFCPDTGRHYTEIWNLWSYIIEQMGDSLKEYRSGTHRKNNIRVLNAEIMGCEREFLPGSPNFESNPTDSISISGSGDASSVTMRLTCNSRGWRPYVGSMLEREANTAIENRVSMILGLAETLGGN